MTYIKTKLKRSIDIDAIITLHYFEYMKNFEFKGREGSSAVKQTVYCLLTLPVRQKEYALAWKTSAGLL